MFTSIQQKPIGIFDSGIGGLTVVKEIINLLPNENLIYFGDTARVPYGNKSNETIKHYAIQNTKFLLHHDVKMIVVACNTASAIALDVVTKYADMPVIGVIKPGALSALANTKNKRVVVIGTNATIANKAYEKEITNLNENIQVIGKACPLFVPIVEEGWQNTEIAFLTAKEYLAPLKKFYFDTLILGCTHYPLLKKVIQKVVGEDVTLVDSAIETAKQVKEILTGKNLLNNSSAIPTRKYFVSDLPHRFKEVGEMFLGQKMESLTKVDIERF